jgi:hypothetical protein
MLSSRSSRSSLRVLGALVLATAALSTLIVAGCSASEGGSATSESNLNGVTLRKGHYARHGGITPGVLVDLVLKNGNQFEASGYPATFWGPANEQSPIEFSGSFTVKGNTLTLLTHKGNPYDAYTVTDNGSSFDFSVTTERGDVIRFQMSYVDGGDTLPVQVSKDPGMPPAIRGGQQLRCQGGMFGTDFSITKSGGWMYKFSGEPKVVDHVKLVQSDAEESDSQWIRLTGSGEKGRDGHNDYEVNIPAAAFRSGAKGVTVDVAAGSESSGVFVAGQVDCDAVE